MATKNGFQQLLLQTIQSLHDKVDTLNSEMKQVRQNDIPKLRIDMEVTKDRQGLSSKIYAAIGGGIAVLISAAMYLWK